MSTRRPKIDDVAKLAQVSKSTVSRVLNNRGYLSQNTIEKVYQAIEELNYRPNTIARQLYSNKTNIIGLIFPTVNNPFYAEMVEDLEKKLFNRGFKVILGNSMNDPHKEETYLLQLLSHQVDGLIVGAHNQDLKEYQKKNLPPIVAIDMNLNPEIPVVSSDNYQGGKIATQLLLKSGAKEIIHINGPASVKSPAQKRRQAYEDVLKEKNLIPHTYTVPFGTSREEKIKSFKRMFYDHPFVDGIFSSNDTDAALIIEIAKELGVKIPQDLKIVGYDGADMTRLLMPSLTTIIQPTEAMAEKAVNILQKLINKEPYPLNVTLPVKLWRGRTT
ncbi:MAG: LacI family DNA-binding transcriptional regulator [Liquorilactobacillus ghanensis]|uniref:LacI family DNA-binding transcriptional regulator n=1 Tax=Liquorilactobacillus ghanensis TaxID=399370 RepID=UPI0039EBBC4A